MPPPRLPPVGRNLVNQRNSKNSDATVTNGGRVPTLITCHVCKKAKPHSQYAKRQILKFQSTIYNPYAPAGRTLTDPKTTCRTCTPQQVTELTCCICTKTKGLTHFAKNQRKNPDVARCMRCVRMHLDTEPDYATSGSDDCSDTEDDDEGDFDDPEDDPEDVKAKRPSAPKIRRALAAQANPASAFHDENTPTDSAQDDDGWGEEPKPAWEVVSVAGRQPAPRHVPATAHGSGGGSTWGSGNSGTVKKGGWAKVEKVPSGMETKWGHDAETDEWGAYARGLTNRRDATKQNQKKKKVTISDDDSEEDWD
jgi:hypothetical protein